MREYSFRKYLNAAFKRLHWNDETNHSVSGPSKPKPIPKKGLICSKTSYQALSAAMRHRKARENEADVEHRANERRMASSTVVMARFTVVLAFVGIASAIISCLQWVAIHGQLEVMQDEQRPWIAAPEIRICKKIGAGNAIDCDNPVGDTTTFSVKMYFTNIGKTGTTGLRIDANLVPGEQWDKEGVEECEKAKSFARSKPDKFKRFTMSPNSKFFIPETPSFDFKNIDIKIVKNMKSPHIVGCIVYGSPFDDKLHQTTFVAPVIVDGNAIQFQGFYTISAN
jgi:hypothetical protein